MTVWRFEFEWTSERTCINCHGSGVIENVRDLRFDELTHSQVKTLFEADVYREQGDTSQDDIPDPNTVQNNPQQLTRGAANPPTQHV